MASSSDAVRNFVYDVHLYNLKKGWKIVQQLIEKQLDSWEKLYAAFPVRDPNECADWDDNDEKSIAGLLSACPLLGDKLAAQLAAQASMFVHGSSNSSLTWCHAQRLGSLQERMTRLQLKQTVPTKVKQTFGDGVRFHMGYKSRLVPFAEAVDHPGFLA